MTSAHDSRSLHAVSIFRLCVAIVTLLLLGPISVSAENAPPSPELLEALQHIPDDAVARGIIMQDKGPLGLAYAAYLAFLQDGSEKNRRAVFMERIATAAHALGADAPYQGKAPAGDAPPQALVIWSLDHIFAAHFVTGSPVPPWILKCHPKEAREAGWGMERYTPHGQAVDTVFHIEKELLPQGAVPPYDELIRLLGELEVGYYNCTGTNYYSIHRIMAVWRDVTAFDPRVAMRAFPLSEKPARESEMLLRAIGIRGIWDKRMIQAIRAAQADARTALAAYLSAQPGFTRDQAEASADYIVWRIIPNEVDREYDKCPTSIDFLLGPPPEIERMDTEWEKVKDIRDRVLAICVLNRSPLDLIRHVMAKGARLDAGVEGAAILAVDDPAYLKEMLILGASPDYRTCFGKTALSYAAQYDALESARLLLDAGGDVNARTWIMDGKSAYELEKDDGNQYVKVLAQRPECQDCYAVRTGGRTPLIYAAWQGQPDMVRLLLKRGADPALADTEGKTALDYVERNERLDEDGKAEMRKLLK